MTDSSFFGYCRELVETRWRFRIGHCRDLQLLHSFFGADVDDVPPIRPIEAVAIEVLGFNANKLRTDRLYAPAEKLGLAKEFALLVEIASIGDVVDMRVVQDIRVELIASLTLTTSRVVVSVGDFLQQGKEPSFESDSSPFE